ncbi:Protein CBG06391 [Caenorhabditis briggsae]|uniref:Protein CBG06391 n=1 Tax=Caenorhabditis briggsae TaxID=6238 RepID=A8X246_CAEBR|nr:Protein CBG06391 [Caenorhabditis briggsae]CAP26706.1 Protein CBG06391 [Caenorhabditis briggsae]
MYTVSEQIILYTSPTEGFQRLARLLEAENQKFSVISYRYNRSLGFGDGCNHHSPSALATRQVKESAPTEKNEKVKKKTTKINFSIGWSSNGRKEGERQRKVGVQRARRQNV